MADVSMCSKSECPLKETCRRYNARPGFMQTYLMTSEGDGNCMFYIPYDYKIMKESINN